MTENLVERIKTLPPLPKTLVEVQAICDKVDGTVSELAKVIEHDPMIVANLLKSANSPLFSFGKEIESVSQAVSLFGMSMTRSIAMNASIKKLLKVDMEPYGISPESFADISSQQAALAAKWFSKVDPSKKDKLFLAALMQETGKILVADTVLQNNESDQFRSDIEFATNIASVETSYVGETSAFVTAAIFKHWKMDPMLIEMIFYSDSPSDVEGESQILASALFVIRTAVPVNAPLSEASITRALAVAKKLGFDHEVLEDSIDEILELR